MANETFVDVDSQDLVISRLVHASRAMLLADEGAGTRYVANVMHPDKATRDRHEELGFFRGWNTCIDQLEVFAQGLR